ncbi:MAG TPA: hypothetical protein VIM16_15905 [Mucilaginibacter sp.]|jgi:Tol biopolymer transport system component
MKYSVYLFIIAICFGCKHPAVQREVKLYTIEQLYNNKAISGAGFNADESQVLVSANNTGIYNIYAIAVTDTAMKPLTHSVKDSYFAVDYVPGTNNFLYSADQGGNENYHIYLQKQGSTTVKDITPWLNSTNNVAGWSDDKKYIYISSNKRNPKFFDIYKLDTASWAPTMFYQNDEGYQPGQISHSERYITLTKPVTTNKNELYVCDLQTKTLKRLSNDHNASWNPQAFDRNDAALYYTTNDGNEFTYLVKYDLSKGSASKVYSTKWDVSGMDLSFHQKYHAIYINEDGKTKMLMFDHATGKQIDFPEIKDGEIESAVFSLSEKNVCLV